MKHAFKKIMALLLAVVMILGILPAAFAANVGPFTDVKESDWFAPYVKFVYEHDPQLMNGVTPTTFVPDGTCTRAMAVTVLYRLADPVIPSVKPSTFTDLKGDWYKNAVAWGQKTGVVKGVTETTFDPDGLVTREQLVTMVWRFYDEPTVEGDNLKSFPDAANVSAYARDAFNWAISKGIIGGSDGKLLPQGNATRAEMAKIIAVFVQKTTPCTEHVWDEGKVTKEPTCTEKGEKLYTCTICGETKTEEVPAKGHNYVDGKCADCGAALASDDEIVIYYTNDVHTYVDKALSYDNIADLKAQTAKVAAGVLLLDAGDHIQGTAYGALDQGKKIIEMMSAAGYDAATLGNHEFDYGMKRALEITEQGGFPYLSANFRNIDGTSVLDAYKIFTVGGKKIAVIGITTPESITKSTPAYFMDETQTNWLYAINGDTLYTEVQAAIDAAKAENPDYIIALGHLGDDPSSAPWRSEDVISNTTGLDAFIDGHSHSTVPMKELKDKGGNTVVLTQTGSYFNAVGKMTIKGDKIATELITSYSGSDATVAAIKNELIAAVDKQLGEKIGTNEVDLTVNDAAGKRAVRSAETNLGDFTADALRYYFNVTEGLHADVAIMNGGGIRANLPAGDVTYKTCKTVHTFGNVACLMEVTGQQILDALEWGAKDVGTGENGGFLQVSGITYEIHSYIKSTVQQKDKIWTGAPTGEYRVKNVKIGGEDLDLTKTYTMAGYNYTIRNMGDGFAMFKDAKLVKDYVQEDYLVLANYVKSFPDATIKADNSPLGANYAAITGEGRIKIVSEKPDVPTPPTSDYVVIFYPKENKVMTTEEYTYTSSTSGKTKIELVGADATLADGKVTTSATNVAEFKMIEADGTVTFQTKDNKYLYCNGTDVKLVDAEDEYTKFVFESTDGGKFIRCATANYNGNPQYIEYYKGYFTTFGMGSDPSIYVFETYPLAGGDEPTPPTPDTNEYVLSSEIKDGDEVIIYNPGYGKAIKNESDRDWYLVAQEVTPADNKITTEDTTIVWTVKKNDDGTYSFLNGENAITAWLSGTYIELTNNANYDGGDIKWNVATGTAENSTFYISSSTIAGGYGPGYLECYPKTDKTTGETVDKICGYSTSSPKEKDCGFQFYVKGATTPTPTPDPDPDPSGDKVFEKVTSDLGTWSGTYVIGYDLGDGNAVIFNGQSIDNGNGVTVAIADNKVTVSTDCAIEIVAVDGGYTVKAKGGYLNGKAAAQNGMKFEETPSTATIVWTDGNPILTSAVGTILRYNNGPDYNDATKNYSWFRFYKADSSVQTPVAFFKLTDETPVVCEHVWNDGVVTTPATCTVDGVKTYTCTKCGATKTEAVPAAGHNYVDGVCTACGAKETVSTGDVYALATELKDGDEVIVVNVEAGKAMSEDAVATKYRAGVDVVPENDKITTDDSKIVWDVVKTDDGYKFMNDAGETLSATSGLSFADTDNVWTLTAGTVTDTFIISSTTAKGTSGDPKSIEWYANYSEFSTFYKNDSNESLFAMKLYVKEDGGETPVVCEHVWNDGVVTTPATCTVDGVKTYTCTKCGATKTEAVPAAGHNYVDGVCTACGAKETVSTGDVYALATELKDGDEVIVVNVEAGKAMSEDAVATKYRAGVDVVPENDKITTDDSKIVWDVVKTDDGYKFMNDAGETLSATSGLSFADTDNVWTLTAGTVTDTFIISSTTAKGTSGDPKSIEWYANYSEFSTFYKNASNESLFAMKLYVKEDGGETPVVCEHDWQIDQIIPASCTVDGETDYICSKCGAEKEEPIAAPDHNYVDGVCTACGAKQPTTGSGYTKVTTAPTDWSGTYLIVFEKTDTTAYAFNGLDESGNFVETTFADNTIAASEALTACEVLVEKSGTGYTFKLTGGTNEGKYLTAYAGRNKIVFSDTATALSVTMEDGTVVIKDGEAPFQFNNGSSNGQWFRFFGKKNGGQSAIALYKLG